MSSRAGQCLITWKCECPPPNPPQEYLCLPEPVKPVCDRQGNRFGKGIAHVHARTGLTEPVPSPGPAAAGFGGGSGQDKARSRRRGRAADLVEADQVECNVLDPVEQAVEFAVVPG